MATILKTFTTADPTITQDVVVDGQAWLANCDKAQTYRLFEVSEPGIDECVVFYRARLKTADLTGRAYLEMWCRLPGRGEFFSKGINHAITGSNDWLSCEIPFILQKEEKPDLFRLNLVVIAVGWPIKKAVTGQIWIKDIELLKAPLP